MVAFPKKPGYCVIYSFFLSPVFHKAHRIKKCILSPTVAPFVPNHTHFLSEQSNLMEFLLKLFPVCIFALIYRLQMPQMWNRLSKHPRMESSYYDIVIHTSVFPPLPLFHALSSFTHLPSPVPLSSILMHL